MFVVTNSDSAFSVPIPIRYETCIFHIDTILLLNQETLYVTMWERLKPTGLNSTLFYQVCKTEYLRTARAMLVSLFVGLVLARYTRDANVWRRMRHKRLNGLAPWISLNIR